jgi:hypothetical protein
MILDAFDKNTLPLDPWNFFYGQNGSKMGQGGTDELGGTRWVEKIVKLE